MVSAPSTTGQATYPQSVDDSPPGLSEARSSRAALLGSQWTLALSEACSHLTSHLGQLETAGEALAGSAFPTPSCNTGPSWLRLDFLFFFPPRKGRLVSPPSSAPEGPELSPTRCQPLATGGGVGRERGSLRRGGAEPAGGGGARGGKGRGRRGDGSGCRRRRLSSRNRSRRRRRRPGCRLPTRRLGRGPQPWRTSS